MVKVAMEFKIKNQAINKRSIDTTELSIALFVLLSFTVQFYSHILFSNTLLIIALLITGLVIIFLNAYKSKTHLLSTSIWIVVFAFIAISILRPSDYISYVSLNKYVDLFVFFAGISLLIFCGNKSKSFRASAIIIIIFAVLYSISVWIQILMPSLYNVFLNFMVGANQQHILEGARTGEFFTGFTSNPGYTAGYILCGIIILLSKRKLIVSNKSQSVVLFIFLILSLLMTARRAHTIFLLLAIVATFVLPYKNKKLKRRIGAVIVASALLLFVIIAFQDILLRIPFFSRIIMTVKNIFIGGVVNSGTSRSSLYAHAWRLFLDNPWFGIGWGNYRYTTVGTVTIKTEMEAHNVYLQLLTETGIVGFFLLMIPISILFAVTLSGIRRLKKEDRESWFPLLSYSLTYQIFFLLYGLTGNPFFDPSFLMMYFFSCAIPMAFIRFREQQTPLHRSKNGIKHQTFSQIRTVLFYSPRISERVRK